MKITIRKKANPLAKAFAESLESVEAEVEMRKLEIVEELIHFMKKEGINRSQLAERLGVGPSRITKILSGDENLTIETLVRAGRALGVELHQHFAPAGHAAHFSTCHRDEIHDAFKVRTVPVERSRVDFILGPKATEDNADAA